MSIHAATASPRRVRRLAARRGITEMEAYAHLVGQGRTLGEPRLLRTTVTESLAEGRTSTTNDRKTEHDRP